MTPQQFKAIMRDMALHDHKRPICAFLLNNGVIYTGHWEPLSPNCTTLIVTLANKEAPPIYISVLAIDAVAPSNHGALS